MAKKNNNSKSTEKGWVSYELFTEKIMNDILYLLGKKDYKVEGKKIIEGVATNWEIEVSAYNETEEKLIIVECKEWKTNTVSQGNMGEFCYRVKDLNAEKGIYVTYSGFQQGAKSVAQKEKIEYIVLREPYNPNNYKVEINGLINRVIKAEPIKIEPKIDTKLVKTFEARLSVNPKISAKIIKPLNGTIELKPNISIEIIKKKNSSE